MAMDFTIYLHKKTVSDSSKEEKKFICISIELILSFGNKPPAKTPGQTLKTVLEYRD